jgi:hypothetical protein
MELRPQQLLADDGHGWQWTRQKPAGPDVKVVFVKARESHWLSRLAAASRDLVDESPAATNATSDGEGEE